MGIFRVLGSGQITPIIPLAPSTSICNTLTSYVLHSYEEEIWKGNMNDIHNLQFATQWATKRK